MNVLVTGAAGYIGSVLCEHLLRQETVSKVVGVDNFRYANQQAVHHLIGNERFALVTHDARDIAGLKREIRHADVVVPLAAVVGAPACDAHGRDAVTTNLDAVAALVDRLSAHQRVLWPNTNSGYGTTDGKAEVDERCPLAPVSLYGRTKCEAESFVLEHPNALSLRLATVFGASPRMRFDLLVNDFFARLYYDGRLDIFEPGFRRSVVHVRDVADAFCFFLTGGRNGVYNVAVDSPSKADLAALVATALGLPSDRVVVGDGRDPDRRNYAVSTRKLRDAGFACKRTLRLGLEELGKLCEVYDREAVFRMRNA